MQRAFLYARCLADNIQFSFHVVNCLQSWRPFTNFSTSAQATGAQAATRNYIVDIAGQLPVILCELDDSSGSITNKYYYANGQILRQDNSTGSYFYIHDRLGSVRLLVNSVGCVVKLYTYNPFGETIEEQGTVDNDFKFAGQYYDKEIGQYYLRARQYSPYLMRFTSRDLVAGKFEEPMSIHRYLYCKNDPINGTDPSGLWQSGQRIHHSSDTGIETDTGKWWLGHSDLGYCKGDFDYSWPDFNLLTNPYFPGTPIHFEKLDTANLNVYLALMAGDKSKFELAVHMGQDYFSHYSKGYRWWSGGHAWDTLVNGINPDDPYVYDSKGNYVYDSGGKKMLNPSFLMTNDWTKQMEDLWYLFDNPFKWIGLDD